jgi:hypothetical protein
VTSVRNPDGRPAPVVARVREQVLNVEIKLQIGPSKPLKRRKTRIICHLKNEYCFFSKKSLQVEILDLLYSIDETSGAAAGRRVDRVVGVL